MITPYRMAAGALTAMLMLTACSHPNRVTLGDYRQIRPGMTYAEIVAITKHPGVRAKADDRINGVILPTNGETVFYWLNPGGSDMSVAFLNGHEVAASEWNL